MDEVGVMVKKEQDFSDTMDREYRALWTQLTKRQITNADDYTTELFEKQIKSQDEENSARLSCLSTAQNSIKNVLKKTSAMYETGLLANYGVNVLSETVTHAQGEVTAFYDRVKTTKHRREDSVASVLRKVTAQKAILDELGESVLVTKQQSAAVDKLSALLSKLKIAEDVSFTSLKENFEGTTLHIKNRASTGDGMRCSIGDFELRTKEMHQVLQKEGALSRLQACKSVSEKLANLCDDLSSTEVELTSRTSARQHEFRTEKETMSEKLFEMERQGAHEREQSTCLNGQLESFRERYGNTVDIRNWDQIRQEKNIREKGELLASLLSEITTFSNDVAALELSTVDHNKEKMHGEFISVLEGDLIAYMELIEREEASAREKNLDSQCRFSAVCFFLLSKHLFN
uniref:Microtub_bind domain-containing protein n=1 Tax=Angiostrongylus cantonensis TaxID=6313 RepID=A0A158PA14_ANGCA